MPNGLDVYAGPRRVLLELEPAPNLGPGANLTPHSAHESPLPKLYVVLPQCYPDRQEPAGEPVHVDTPSMTCWATPTIFSRYRSSTLFGSTAVIASGKLRGARAGAVRRPVASDDPVKLRNLLELT